MKESICLYSYRFGRFELQPSERRLLAAGQPAVVEPRAFDVLVALVERTGHLVTKEELFSLVWPHLVVEENNLQVQISALRKILGPAAIATVSGQGYRFTMDLTRQIVDSVPPVTAAKTSPEPLHVAGESIDPVPMRTNVVPLLRPSREALETAPSGREEAPHPHPSVNSRRWPWIVGGVAAFLIAAAAWVYETTKATPQTAVTAEPPTLSIAILPFAGPADEQLAATLMPEITAAFWRNGRSARLASPELVAPYQGKHVDARAIGRELNVRYVAEGEIGRADDTRLLNARLIDATNGAQIWTDQFEVPAEELPSSHALATRVARHIWFALLDAEKDRVAHQLPTNLTATDLWLRGAAMDIRRLDDALAARKVLEKALELDPRLVGAMVNLAFTYETQLDTFSLDGDRIRKEFDELSLRAVATDPTDPRAWDLRTMALFYNNRLEEALEASWEMQRIEPNHVVARGWRSVVLIAMGRSEEALAELDQGIALDPNGRDIAFLLRQKCKAYSFLGQYEKAIPTCEQSATNQRFVYPFMYLAADYAQLGQMDKAALAKAQLLKLNPGFTIARYTFPPNAARNRVWVRQAETYVIPGLRKAGIPET
jgi:DNA-binding winged helix-turn-helix (wHTH) protein/TolB-like protein